ncbi:MAG: tRNA (guanosine(18)-2'-O)-methyltransferase [Chlamydiae bacterium]|nr:tRNA (guanosine(18)-2'-O)-methyltransferase [Chlamydiota bacterium]
MNYNPRKFRTFPEEWQHKKCAELLRQLYENGSKEMLEHYNEIQLWMDGEPLSHYDPKKISDRYHRHLKQAKVYRSEQGLLPNIRTHDREFAQGPTWPIAIYLDHIRSAHNVGSILRTIEAFSLGNAYFSQDTPYIDHHQVQKTSMGTFQHVTCYPNATLDTLPRPLIAMETSNDAIAIQDFLFPEKFTLAIGNEEYGCSDEVLQRADNLLEIPLRGRKNSLNVANAFAIAAVEISKQKLTKGEENENQL